MLVFSVREKLQRSDELAGRETRVFRHIGDLIEDEITKPLDIIVYHDVRRVSRGSLIYDTERHQPLEQLYALYRV